jgi:hypothetical protein
MLPIFEKLENVKINALDLLQPDDKTYCENIFNLYNAHYSFIKNLLDKTSGDYTNHLAQFPLDIQDFYHAMYYMDKYFEGLEGIKYSLEERVITKIENYFKELYNIVFDRYEIKNKESLSLENIIDNIIQQSGTDLTEAGKMQIITTFQKNFFRPSKQPLLKNNKISLPNYFFLRSALMSDEMSLEYNDRDVSILLDAIALFLFDTTNKTEIFIAQLEEWKQNIDFSKFYSLQNDVSIKFFKNRRIDIAFNETEMAEKFWEKFQLENITMIN